MGNGARSRARAVPIVVAVILAACAGSATRLEAPFGTAPATPKAPYTQAPPTPVFSPSRIAPPPSHANPYDEDALFGLLAGSPRVPDVLKNRELAAALAARIWSYDGQPYQEVFLEAECDEKATYCELGITGVPAFAADRDASDSYLFTVRPRTGVIEGDASDGLGGYPRELEPEIDAAVRALLGDRIPDDLLPRVGWMLPPPDDAWVLWYGKGAEYGEPFVQVRYDRATDTVLSVWTE